MPLTLGKGLAHLATSWAAGLLPCMSNPNMHFNYMWSLSLLKRSKQQFFMFREDNTLNSGNEAGAPTGWAINITLSICKAMLTKIQLEMLDNRATTLHVEYPPKGPELF